MERTTVSNIHVGCSGWVYKHWRGIFYPEGLPQKRWFERYADEFDTVEINASFYRLPLASTFEAWRAKAPPDFRYAVKVNRFITHMKKLLECEAESTGSSRLRGSLDRTSVLCSTSSRRTFTKTSSAWTHSWHDCRWIWSGSSSSATRAGLTRTCWPSSTDTVSASWCTT